jgi:Mg-chelatase subunit ChlD
LHQLTDDVNIAKQFINKTIASGGGDLPEAICCGLADCLNKIDWLESSVKIAILIADAPPHGLCIPGDGFPNGCPLNNDPIEIAHRLAQNGITLYCVGCEPALAPYRDFFMVLSSVTGGRYLLLDNADNLSNVN